ncbi:MAG: hypothetical protein KKA10_03545 [Euryarchaeota archaeon]|nr:hypothetical protein [Euryarchaeota archaeon]MCG2736813.1 hypothetical protein [Candidatus Methanoperedenaceae archaeon]
MKTIEDLRNLVKLNLCESCFQKYKALVEPSIREWLFEPISDWKKVESHVTQMVMKTNGVFKGKMIFISLDKGSNEKYSDEVDVNGFQEIKKWSFKRKIDYLHKKGILQDASYRFLDKAREVRNRIHDEFAQFSEQDLTLFYIASVVTYQIWSATMLEWGEDISVFLKSNAEKVAEQCLLKINGSESIRPG